MAQGEVGIDELDAVFCILYGVEIETADDVFRDVWLAVDDAHHLLPGTPAGVRLQPRHIIRIRYPPVVFGAVYILS